MADFHNETDKRALLYQCTASLRGVDVVRLFNTVFAHTSLEMTKSDRFSDRELQSVCARHCLNHHFPELALIPSLPVFAVYLHAIKDDLSLFTTDACFGSWIPLSTTTLLLNNYCRLDHAGNKIFI